MVAIVGGAATLELCGGSMLIAGTTVGMAAAVLALPIAVVSGTIYLLGKS